MNPMNKAQRTFALMKLVEAEYASSGMRDAEFADHATKKLGFEVARASITKARADLGIANNAEPATASTMAAYREARELLLRFCDVSADINEDNLRELFQAVQAHLAAFPSV